MRSGPSYNHYDAETGEANPPSEYNNEYGSEPVVYNAVILSFYLFAPFWMIYFAIGGVLAFIYDAYKVRIGFGPATFMCDNPSCINMICCFYYYILIVPITLPHLLVWLVSPFWNQLHDSPSLLSVIMLIFGAILQTLVRSFRSGSAS